MHLYQDDSLSLSDVSGVQHEFHLDIGWFLVCKEHDELGLTIVFHIDFLLVQIVHRFKKNEEVNYNRVKFQSNVPHFRCPPHFFINQIY